MATYGQQPDNGYEDGYLRKKFGNPEIEGLEQQADTMVKTAQMADAGTDVSGTPGGNGVKEFLTPSPAFSKGAERGAGGGIGSMVLSGGIASGNPLAMGAGAGLMMIEGNAKSKKAREEAQMIEAQDRKAREMAAINNLINVSKGLTLGA